MDIYLSLLEKIKDLFLSLQPSDDAKEKLQQYIDELAHLLQQDDGDEDNEKEFLDWFNHYTYLAVQLGSCKDEDETKKIEEEMNKCIAQINKQKNNLSHVIIYKLNVKLLLTMQSTLMFLRAVL